MRGGEEEWSSETDAANVQAATLSAGDTWIAAAGVSGCRRMSRSSIRTATPDAVAWDAQQDAEDAFKEGPVSGVPS